MQDEAYMHVKHCIAFGSCSFVHCVGDGGKINGGNIVCDKKRWDFAYGLCLGGIRSGMLVVG